MKHLYIRDNSGRATLAIVFLAAMLLVEMTMAYFEYTYHTYLAQTGTPATDMHNLELQLGFMALIGLVIQIISATTFVMWFRRAYFNVHQINKGARYDEAWAAGAWFIPILCYIRPYQIMSEMKRTVNQYLREHLNYEPKSNPIEPLWWLLWVLGSIIGAIAFRLDAYVESNDARAALELMSAVSSVILVPAAILAILVVHNHAKKEKQLYNFYLLHDTNEAT